jgi:hypothetical protein
MGTQNMEGMIVGAKASSVPLSDGSALMILSTGPDLRRVDGLEKNYL